MAADALAAYTADIAAGKDALLVCDTTEMADALNQRLHHDTIAAGAPTVTAARGHAIAVGDVILTRHNDPSIALRNTDDPAAEQSPVRNGQRWRVIQSIPTTTGCIACRLDDNTLGAFPKDYVREHITYGYALTVHSAQGVTADTTHAVLSENATRALSLCRHDPRARHEHRLPLRAHHRTGIPPRFGSLPARPHRSSRQYAATVLRGIVARDDHPATAHDIAATTATESQPARVRAAVERRARTVRDLSSLYRRWRDETVAYDHAVRTARSRDIGADRSIEGLEL